MGSPKQHKTWYDEDAVDDAALALLHLTSFRRYKDGPVSAWKGLAWEIIDRLEARGLLYNSRTAKSVTLTEEGAQRSERLFKKLFGTPKRAELPPQPESEEDED